MEEVSFFSVSESCLCDMLFSSALDHLVQKEFPVPCSNRGAVKETSLPKSRPDISQVS